MSSNIGAHSTPHPTKDDKPKYLFVLFFLKYILYQPQWATVGPLGFSQILPGGHMQLWCQNNVCEQALLALSMHLSRKVWHIPRNIQLVTLNEIALGNKGTVGKEKLFWIWFYPKLNGIYSVQWFGLCVTCSKYLCHIQSVRTSQIIIDFNIYMSPIINENFVAVCSFEVLHKDCEVLSITGYVGKW